MTPKRRLNVTLSPDLVAAYQRLLPKLGKTLSGFLEEVLVQSLPGLVKAEAVLDEAKRRVMQGEQLSLEDVQGQLVGVLESTHANVGLEVQRLKGSDVHALVDEAADGEGASG